jgi:hypothetical protein
VGLALEFSLKIFDAVVEIFTINGTASADGGRRLG